MSPTNDLYQVIFAKKTFRPEQLQDTIVSIRNIMNLNKNNNQKQLVNDALVKVDSVFQILKTKEDRMYYDTFFHRPINLIMGDPEFEQIKLKIKELQSKSTNNIIEYLSSLKRHELLGINYDCTRAQLNESKKNLEEWLNVYIDEKEVRQDKMAKLRENLENAYKHYVHYVVN